MKKQNKIKIIIIVLAVLLALSLAALGGTLIYNKIANTTPATVTVPDNLITPDDDITKPDSSDTEKTDDSYMQTPDSSAAASSSAVPTQSTTAEVKKAATIELYNKQPEENTPFQVENMFPGDSSVVLYFADTGRRRGTRAALAETMLRELKNTLGEGNVVVK